MNTHTLTYSNKRITYQILDHLSVAITIQENPYSIPLEELFVMAARINKKRSFLFVSKLLGKHLPIEPAKGLILGDLLAARYLEVVHLEKPNLLGEILNDFLQAKEHTSKNVIVPNTYNPIVIGFAETATALGHSFFEAFEKADFFHSTREVMNDTAPIISFEEEHSHATSHRAYINEKLLKNDREIILVDDELTTGKTAINIIRSLHNQFPREVYTVVSILDWRNEEHINEFRALEKELGIVIHTVSLVKGTVEAKEEAIPLRVDQLSLEQKEQSVQNVSFIHLQSHKSLPHIDHYSVSSAGEINPHPFLRETGRFGLTSEENTIITEWTMNIGKELAKRRKGRKTLCVGTGEFMYIPMKVAHFMGEHVFFQSTTRSPIYVKDLEGYGARHGLAFPNPEDTNIEHFIYNIVPDSYDDAFLFFERKVSLEEVSPFLEQFKRTNIIDITICYFTAKTEDENHG